LELEVHEVMQFFSALHPDVYMAISSCQFSFAQLIYVIKVCRYEVPVMVAVELNTILNDTW